MRAIYKSLATGSMAVAGAVALGAAPTVAPPIALSATTQVLIMGGTGTPRPDAEPGYVQNVERYYIYPWSSCDPATCESVSVETPETAWPLYGGLSALTWQQSILQGADDYDAAVQAAQEDSEEGDTLVLFGYSQSGAILALQMQKIADNPELYDKTNFEVVVIGNVSRPNGGLNGRLPITIPIVQFPYGPVTPTDTGIKTTDIAMKWDIIADAPLYVLNPLAMLNALMGGPGFGIIHGTYPNPEGDPVPTDPNAPGPGGYTQAEWQSIMDDPYGTDPDSYVAQHPGVVEIEEYNENTTYITVTPKILPLVQPLHSLGLKPIADLIEPALRVIIEETGYDRDSSYGTPTTFRLIPIFNPVTLAFDLVPAIQQGVDQFVEDLGGSSTMTTTDDNVLATSFGPLSDDSAAADVVTPLSAGVDELTETDETTEDTTDTDSDANDTDGNDETTQQPTERPHIFRPFQQVRERLHELFNPQAQDNDDNGGADNSAVETNDPIGDATDTTDTTETDTDTDTDSASPAPAADAA